MRSRRNAREAPGTTGGLLLSTGGKHGVDHAGLLLVSNPAVALGSVVLNQRTQADALRARAPATRVGPGINRDGRQYYQNFCLNQQHYAIGDCGETSDPGLSVHAASPVLLPDIRTRIP